jgi:hypothetical protein
MEISLNDVFLEGVVAGEVEFFYLKVEDGDKDLFPTVDKVERQRGDTQV